VKIVFVMAAALGLSLTPAIESTKSHSTGDDWRNRLLTDAPAKWAALADFYTHLEGKVTLSGEALKLNGIEQKAGAKLIRRVEFRLNGKMGLRVTFPLEAEKSDRPGIAESHVKGINSRYAFKINRPTATKPYAVTYYGPPLADFYTMELVQTDMAVHLMRGPYCLSGGSLDEFIKLPGMRIDKVSLVEGTTPELVRMEFSRSYHEIDRTDNKGRELPQTSFFRGWIDFEPNNYWCIRQYQNEWPGAGYQKRGHNDNTVIEYGKPIDGFPVVQRITSLLYNDDHSTESKQLCEFQDIVHRMIPEKEFTLSAFGVAEIDPELGIASGTSLWPWFLLITLLLALAAFGFAKLAKRRAAA
jgi:hypothetical protein